MPFACVFRILFFNATVKAASDALLPFQLIPRQFHEIKSEEIHMQVHHLRFFRCLCKLIGLTLSICKMAPFCVLL